MKPIDWISVKDKLPNVNDTVLICQTFANGSRIVRQATFVNIKGSETFIDENGVDCYFISHWQKMVLPNEQKSEDVSERDIIYKFLQSDNPKGIMKIMNYPYDENKSHNKNCLEFVNKIKEEGRIKELLNAIKT